jgi:hypothetical protein
VVPRRFLEILSPDPKKREVWREGSGRLQLALAIANPNNPLTARVFVNRMWQQHWGVGFVETPDDLGNMSSSPTHPELLDWLAATFVENKWSIKALHRTIMLSAAYQQSGQNNPAFAEKDPNNKLLWRFNLRRLDFEELHDSLLAITGELNSPTADDWLPSAARIRQRRSIYTLIDRQPPELLTQFDFPVPTSRPAGGTNAQPTGALPDEQPDGDRDGAQTRRSPGIRGTEKRRRACDLALPRNFPALADETGSRARDALREIKSRRHRGRVDVRDAEGGSRRPRSSHRGQEAGRQAAGS